MKRKKGRMLGVVWLCVACLGLLMSLSSAHEPKLRRTLRGHDEQIVNSVAYSPDSKMLASGSVDYA
ncbi:MAG TPA: WD40 repeat domain-containing protein, partial [Acidimicrobiales bacterium]|nr:WD40 repeat domain-containing protein [Acidimicrobiales bacterium]